MSHQVGTVQLVTPPLVIGPDSGSPATSPNTWVKNFAYAPAPTGTKFLILHFINVNLPGAHRLEVDLGYDTDVFTAADGASFWTRPVNPAAFGGGTVPVRYITDGSVGGSAELDQYGRGERLPGIQDPNALSNCDPFLHDASYVEPVYDPFWFCANEPASYWENSTCVPAGDIRAAVAPSVGMIVTVETEAGNQVVSTCSVTLIGPDTIITAGHCHTPAEALSSSVIFNYQTTCTGSRPGGYVGRFHKVVRVIRQRYADGSNNDYSILQLRLPPGGLGITPIPLRQDLPAAGEQVFNISHPNGAVKKQSLPHPGYATIAQSSASAITVASIDVSGGSSGSGLFDTGGRYLGILSNGTACDLHWFPISSVLADIAAMPGAPPVTRDVMIVFDRSGSMSMDAGTGRTKIDEARDAASLFIELVRAATGNRVGLVSFSTTASSAVDAPLADLTDAEKITLVGPAPYSSGIVGALTPGGTTTIGGGLDAGRVQLPPGGSNPRAILLMTDGLQNTPPMIADVTGALAGIDVHAIGFGTEASLDGALLSQLAQSHNGLYTRAGSPLDLKKFFALAFGNIFEAGALTDPAQTLPAGQDTSSPLVFHIFDEDTATVVVGWDGADTELGIIVTAPTGTVLPVNAPGIENVAGRTWRFLRIPLPQNGEREGAWTVQVSRPPVPRELKEGDREVTFFVSVIASGGPNLRRQPSSRAYYTGDPISPLVGLAYAEGGAPPNPKVKVTITKPVQSVGEVLTHAEQQPAQTLDGDTIPARQATLAALGRQSGTPAITYEEVTYDLFDDPSHTNTFEASGIFGALLENVLTAEGNYNFHYLATYGDNYQATRELAWSLHVDTGIDQARTSVTTTIGSTGPDGKKNLTITIVPRDRYGNHLGPGRSDSIGVSGAMGTIASGPAADNGDGSYTVRGRWNPKSGQAPAIVISQPGRAPTTLGGQPQNGPLPWLSWKLLSLLLIALIVILLVVIVVAN